MKGPLLTFNPAFTLLLAWPTWGEAPGLRQTIGVAVVLLGASLLDVEEARTALLAPPRLLLHRPGTLLAIAAAALWETTVVLEKLAIDHMTPPSGPAVALIGTFLLVALLTPGHQAQLEQRSRLSPRDPGRGSVPTRVLSPPSCSPVSPRSLASRRLRSASSGR